MGLFLDNKFTFKWNSSGTTVAGMTTNPGNSARQLDHPATISIDRWDNFYVADTSNNRVQRWTPGSTNGTTVAGREDGVYGSNLSELHNPFGLVVDNSGGLYIADTWNHRVMYWSNGSSSGRIVAGNGKSYGANVLSMISTDIRHTRNKWIEHRSTLSSFLCHS
jgi:hypothetical protein